MRDPSGVARKPAKVSLIGPDRISQRFDYQASTPVYRDMDDFLVDVVAIERTIVKSLMDAGCRYVQIDAPGFTAYVDAPSVAQMSARGEDPMANFARSLKAVRLLTFGFSPSGCKPATIRMFSPGKSRRSARATDSAGSSGSSAPSTSSKSG